MPALYKDGSQREETKKHLSSFTKMDYAKSIAVGAITVFLAVHTMVRSRRAILVPGPRSPSWIFGHMLQLLLPGHYGEYEFAWQKAYGPLYTLRGCLGQERLMVSDPIALQFILNSPHFEHGPTIENAMHLMFEENAVMATKGETHKRFRAALNAGFGPAAVRNYQPIFEKVAHKMLEEFQEASNTSPIDICPILSDATLSAMSEATFGYSSQDLGEEFVASNAQIMVLSCSQSAHHILAEAVGNQLPRWLARAVINLPTRTLNIIRTTKYLAKEVGKQIVREKLEVGQKGMGSQMDVYDMLLDQSCSDKKRNALSADEIVAQTGILLLGGQDTTANTLSWGLIELARNPEFQQELRTEILSSTSGGIVDYDSLPMLNAFIKELLRFHPAGAIQERVAIQDTVLPLADGIRTSTGELTRELELIRGQVVMIAVASYQRRTSIWGEDAHEFRPSRWIDGTITQGHSLGPYANLLSFLGGPRVCLGWRFGILEMQVFFYTLVGKLVFSLPKDNCIRARFATTLIPVVANGEKGAPLRVTQL
ncbi:cytochrome P450 [Mycena vitilis]|nr:cytochrome P450 [Mycena vitilis]